MADVLLSPLVSTILENLSSLFLEEVVLARSLKTQLKSLESTLTTIQAVLLDAEEKQSKSAALKDWLDKLKHAAYDVEDMLDDFKQEARECSLRKDARSKVYSFLFPRIPLSFRIKMGRKFKDAREKLDAIAAEKNKFHLTEGAGDVTTQPNEDRQTSSLVKESQVFGREDEKEKLVSMLLSNATASHHDDLSVYAICGMGGLGKTTLAQLVYKSVAKAFDLRVWVCVSDDFGINRMTKAILESIEGYSCNIQEIDPLQQRLVEKLAGKRFLLVLDDVWNENHEKWDKLKQPLQRGRRGSTIIVTTRAENIALMMAGAADRVHHLGCLSIDDSWYLFKQRAFGME
ncbi:hypothetical protein GQ457_06G026780 [Hibiscus cannabinus]